MADRDNQLLRNYRNAWQALRMVRETVETLGPPGVLLSEDGVLRKYGPEPIHEGQAIVDALTTILAEPKPKPATIKPREAVAGVTKRASAIRHVERARRARPASR
jgi:hypothetical protein